MSVYLVCLSACLTALSFCSHEGHSMVTYGQTSSKTATPMPHASGRTRCGRDVSWSKPHLIGCPVRGVFRVDFQHPKRGDGSSSSNQQSIARGQRKKMCGKSISEWNRLDGIDVCTVLRAISGAAVAKAFLHPSLLPASLCPFSLSPPLPPLPPSLPPHGPADRPTDRRTDRRNMSS